MPEPGVGDEDSPGVDGPLLPGRPEALPLPGRKSMFRLDMPLLLLLLPLLEKLDGLDEDEWPLPLLCLE